MRLVPIVRTGGDECGGDSCPTIYRDEEHGSYVFQGFRLSAADRASLAMPDGEDAIEVPEALVARLLERLGHP